MGAILFKYLFTAMFSLMHPYYISMMEIVHNKTNNTIEISIRIFTDDLEKTIRQTYNGKVDLLNRNEQANSEKLIGQYIIKHLSIKADNKNLNLQFLGFESEEGSIWSYFQCPDITSLQTLEVNNTLLYDYKEQQVNFIHVKAAGLDETTKLSYPDSYKKFTLQ